MFSPLRRFIDSLKGSRNPRQTTLRLHLESLDERVVPATCTFINVNGGFIWDNSNWMGDAVPAEGDTIVIPANVTGTVTFNSAPGYGSALSTYGQLQIGTLNSNNSVTIAMLQNEEFTNGIVEQGTGGGKINITGTLLLSGGISNLTGDTINGIGSGLGTFQLDSGAILNISGGTTQVFGTNITNDGTINFGLGLNSGTLSMSQAGCGTFTNTGTINVAGGTGDTFTANSPDSAFTSSGTINVGTNGNTVGAIFYVDSYNNNITGGSVNIYQGCSLSFTADLSYPGTVGLNTYETTFNILSGSISGTPCGSSTIGIQSSGDNWYFSGNSTLGGNWDSSWDIISPIAANAAGASSTLSGGDNWTWTNDTVTDYLQFSTGGGGGGLGGGMGGAGGSPAVCTAYSSGGSLSITSTSFTEIAINTLSGSDSFGLVCLCFSGGISGTFSPISTTSGVTYTQTTSEGYFTW